MKPTIEIYRENVYGSTLFYAKDSVWAKNYKELTGDKSLTEKKMKAFSQLTGISFREVLKF